MKIIKVKGINIKLENDKYEIAQNYRWNINLIRKMVYTKIDGKVYTMSKLIFGIKENELLYHLNGNSFDFINVIKTTRADFPKLARTDKKSRYKNVYQSRNNMWMILFPGEENKKAFKGRFYTQKDAAIASDYITCQNDKSLECLNFKWESETQLNEKYEEMIKKYGKSTSERISKLHQGRKQKKVKKQTSKYVGVYFTSDPTRSKRWVAEIRKDKKRYCLGYYENEEDAAKAYDEKAIELYGDSAILNFKRPLMPLALQI